MIFKRTIKAILNNLGLSIKKIPRNIKDGFEQYQIPNEDFIFDSKKQIIDLKKIGVSQLPITKENLFILQGYTFLKELKDRCNTKLFFDEYLHVEIENCIYRLHTWEEILILKEIFLDGIYNLCLPKDQNAIFIDIGMNVGITSIFYAKKSCIKSVYSFEPFRETFDLAQENIQLNSDIKRKINITNFGLGNTNREEHWDYFKEYKGSMGMNGIPDYIQSSSDEIKKIKITIKDVSKILEEIFSRHLDSKIILKVDCEGAEYEIFEKLNETKNLDKIDYLLLEWHKKGPQRLKEILSENHFSIFSFNEKNKDIGMIYAVKLTNLAE